MSDSRDGITSDLPSIEAQINDDKPHVLFLTPDVSFPPRIYKAVKTLANSGYSVKVIGWDRGKQRSLFQLPEGVQFEPIVLKAPFGSLLLAFYLLRLYVKIIGRIWNDNCEIIHCCRFDMLIPASFVAKLRGKKLIYDAFEYYPLMVGNHFHGVTGKIVVKSVSLLEETFARMADMILTVDTADDILLHRFERVNDRVVVIQNVPELSGQVQIASMIPSNVAGPALFYAGGLMRMKGIFEMVQCLKHVKDEVPTAHLLLAGSFNSGTVASEIKKIISELKLDDNISFLGYIPYEEVRQYAHYAKVGLELYHHHPYLSISKGSSKLFMYMEAGLPIIASDLPGIGSLIRETGAGLVVDPYKPEAIARSIISILQDDTLAKKLSQKGQNAFHTKYNWDVEQTTFLLNYEQL